MLAGLIFATDDADDRPGVLAATLPFGGLTLIEFQARLLIDAGAAQIVLVVARMTPELLGAINRIARRGISVDAVRGAGEVVEKLHPLARVLVVADGVVTTGDTLALLAQEGGDALLVTDQPDAAAHYERVGALSVWVGLARLAPGRIAEVAAMPKDYDFQSTLLRVAAQAGAEQVRLSPDEVAHGIERDSRALAARGNAILAALVSRPIRWAERYVAAPVSRLVLPVLTGRVVPTFVPIVLATLLTIGGGAAFHFELAALGLVAAIIAILALESATALAWLRDEGRVARVVRGFVWLVAALAGLAVTEGSGDRAIAIAAIVAAALAERARSPAIERRWWGSPLAYLLLLLPIVAVGYPTAALIVAALYAAVTLFASIEALREKP